MGEFALSRAAEPLPEVGKKIHTMWMIPMRTEITPYAILKYMA